MKLKSLLLQGVLMVASVASYASGNDVVSRDPNLKTFITNNKKLHDPAFQHYARTTGAWKNFSEQHRNWSVIFSEETGKPVRAFGEPIAIGLAGDPQAKAYTFITGDLVEFNIPVNELQYRNTATNQKYHYVNYKQFHNGLEVLWANIQVKMTLEGKVMLFGLKVYDNINISLAPSLSSNAAGAAASNLTGVSPTAVTVNPDLKILPIPVNYNNDYRLVYEVTVDGRDVNNFRSIYYTLVDANTGEILYRQDRVCNANIDVTVTGTLYKTHPFNPATVEPLKNLRFSVGAANFVTDTAGYAGLTNNPPVNATFYLEGPWTSVNTNGVVPSFTETLNLQTMAVSFDNDANIKELSAFHAVQEIHDYYKEKATGNPTIETTMDFQITTNIDVAGTCNAYYDGSLNFFDAGGGCNPTSEVADVVYHEYGHGINFDVYAAYGGFFGNGSLNEGYADTWANGLTEDPVLGIGFFTNPNDYVRRYDINKKVYPQDLTGEVHANGEIIGGCWWDTYLNLGNMDDRQDLFLMTFTATLDEPDGAEGVLFQNVLIEALTDDDNDGNLANGTPHYCEITSAFAIHGITVSGVASALNHSELLSAAGQAPIVISGTASNLPNAALPYGYYKINGTGTWTQFPLNNTGGNNYAGTIPAQPNGTIVHYYVDLFDSCGTHTGIMPAGAHEPVNPNIPYYILVGYNLLDNQELEGATTGWVVGSPTDNATTGIWTSVPEDPNPTFLNGNTGLVQTGDDHTAAPGNKCFITGNDPDPAPGNDDLDGGHTTLTSATYDLSTYTNPAFSYWRWFSNDQGATPGTAFWETSISNDGGVTWVDVENMNVPDHSWRRYAFKVVDYVTPTANVKLRFIGSDGPAPSLVEVALDDIQLWDEVPTSVNEIQNIVGLSVYPNPAVNEIKVSWNQAAGENVSLQITDHLGQVVYGSDAQPMSTGLHTVNISTNEFANGIYFLNLKGENSNVIKKITVMK